MVTKSNGPRPKKGRLGKKKRRLVEAHTLSHLRGNHDYSYSHTRTREIDARVAGAGILGARIKAPRHHGVTVPAVPAVPQPKSHRQGRQMPLRAPTRRSLTIMGPQGPKGADGRRGERGKQGYVGRKGKSGKNGYNGREGRPGEKGDKGETGDTGKQGLTGGHGPRGPSGKNGKEGLRGEQGVRGLQGKKGVRGEVGFRGAPGRRGAEEYAGLNGLVGPIGPAGPQGPQGNRGIRGNIDYVFNADGRGADTDMVVRGADVYRRQAAPHAAAPPKPKPAPAPQPAPRPRAPPFKAEKKPFPNEPKADIPKGNPFQGGGFHGGAEGPAPKPKNRRQEKPEERQERRQEQHKRPGRKAPVKPATEEDERAHDQANIDAAVANNRKTSEMRKQLAQRNRDRKAAREANLNESRAGKMPVNHGEHPHHHIGHRKMHDDNFTTGL